MRVWTGEGADEFNWIAVNTGRRVGERWKGEYSSFWMKGRAFSL